MEIALACDLIVAAKGAKLGIPEAKRSLVAAGGALLRLPQRMPYHVVMELALTGDLLPAERFHEFGVVNRLAEPGSAVDVALELAGRLAKSGPLALVASKRILQEQFDWSHARRCGSSRARSPGPCSPPRTPKRARAPSRRSGTPCGKVR